LKARRFQCQFAGTNKEAAADAAPPGGRVKIVRYTSRGSDSARTQLVLLDGDAVGDLSSVIGDDVGLLRITVTASH
jgi:hypothetical protein